MCWAQTDYSLLRKTAGLFDNINIYKLKSVANVKKGRCQVTLEATIKGVIWGLLEKYFSHYNDSDI